MQCFTTEMVFMHPPRTGRYTAPRRLRYGCRTTSSRVDTRERHAPAVPMPGMTPAETGPTLAIDRAD